MRYLHLHWLLVAVLAISGCDDKSSSGMQGEGLDKSSMAPMSPMLDSNGRAKKDQDRDAGRKPLEVLEFLGVKPGMVVIDLIAAGGYYTEVLSLVVGPSGKVYAQNPPVMLEMRDGAADKEMTARLANNRLGNVMRLDKDINEAGLEANSLDVAITALNFHDIMNREGGDKLAMGTLRLLKKLLKPGGVLGIVDHNGNTEYDNTKLHRLDVEMALPIIYGAGFQVEQSAILRNPDDDLSLRVFEPSVRGHTDRLAFKLTKPR